MIEIFQTPRRIGFQAAPWLQISLFPCFTFPLFSSLPPEIRDMIWVSAVQPRIVSILECHHPTPSEITTFTSWQLRNKYQGKPPLYLYSTSPIPPLLHTCCEARAALMKDGYVLTFGAAEVASFPASATTPLAIDTQPRIWFHFEKDVLNHQTSYPRSSRHFLNTLRWVKRSDLARVKRLAITCSLADMELSITGRYYSHLAEFRRFPELEELLVVQYDVRRGWRESSFEKDEGLVGYVECDIADALGYSQPGEPVINAWVAEYCMQILELKRKTHMWDRQYFRDLAKKLERWIWGECESPYIKTNDWFFETVSCPVHPVHQRDLSDKLEAEKYRSRGLPRVKLVHVVSRKKARELMELREKFWGQVQEVEDREAQLGFRPSSPFSVQWEDAIQAAEAEAYAAYRYHVLA